jgi:hypothetical protein
MAPLAFTFVPVEGFVGFEQALESDAWAAIKVADWEGPNRVAAKSIGDAPVLVGLKLRLRWGIAELAAALEGAASSKDNDTAWDNAQKQLNGYLAAAAASSDPQKRDAAKRLQKSLLLGAGEGQTKLKYQQEVDFGRKQVLLMSQGQGAADVALLGLAPVKGEIATTTEALASAIGHGDSGGRPFERRDAAVALCRAAFAHVSDSLAWLSLNGQPGTDRDRAAALRLPLENLVARYPAPSSATEAPAPEAPTVGGSTAGG